MLAYNATTISARLDSLNLDISSQMMDRRKFIKGAVDDLVLLDDDKVNEDGIVANLKERFALKYIYTYIGPVLLSCNPFQMINGLYTPE